MTNNDTKKTISDEKNSIFDNTQISDYTERIGSNLCHQYKIDKIEVFPDFRVRGL